MFKVSGVILTSAELPILLCLRTANLFFPQRPMHTTWTESELMMNGVGTTVNSEARLGMYL